MILPSTYICHCLLYVKYNSQLFNSHLEIHPHETRNMLKLRLEYCCYNISVLKLVFEPVQFNCTIIYHYCKRIAS